jgi:hypothetical protein
MFKPIALLGLFLWASSTLVAAATGVLPRDAVLINVQDWSTPMQRGQTDLERVQAKLAAGDAAAAYALMQGWQDPERFEVAAVLVIRRLSEQPLDKAGRALLERLAQEPVRLYRRHEETAADWFVPLFDVGAQAASLLKLTDFQGDRDRLIDAIARDPGAALAALPDAPALVAAAFEAMPLAMLDQVAMFVLADGVGLPSPAWTMLAQRLPRQDLLNAALVHADPVDLLPLIATIAAQSSSKSNVAWLERAATHAPLASAAVLALGRMAPSSPEAYEALLKHLGRDTTGASAATALARWPAADRVERIETLIGKASDSAVLADLALALRLEGSERALRRLEVLGRDPRLPESARSELQP